MTTAEQVTRELTQLTERAIGTIALRVSQAIQQGNPVLTGYSKNNWIINEGSPYVGTAGTRDQALSGVLVSGPRMRGEATAMRYRLSMGDLYITNNVMYIGFLNTLHPNRLFVQRGIAIGVRRASQEITR